MEEKLTIEELWEELSVNENDEEVGIIQMYHDEYPGKVLLVMMLDDDEIPEGELHWWVYT